MKDFDSLVARLGLSGSWLQVTRDALVSPDMLLHPGCYFLDWDRNAIIFEQIDSMASRLRLGTVRWISAHRLRTPEDDGGVGDRWQSSFQALEIYPGRSQLLQECGFVEHKGPFALMELIPTEWPR